MHCVESERVRREDQLTRLLYVGCTVAHGSR